MATAARTVDLDKPYDRILSPVERTALDYIRKQAREGKQVTRADIAVAIGSQNLWGGTAPGVLNRLEEKGYITRTFYQRGLQVCDVESGLCTAAPASRATHWRLRQECVPTPPLHIVRQRAPTRAGIIENEARRHSMSMQDFLMDLIDNGLELYLEKQENDDA